MSYYTRSPDEYTQTQSLRLEIYFVADPLLIYTRLDISLFLHLLLCSILWWFSLVSTTETCVCVRARACKHYGNFWCVAYFAGSLFVTIQSC